MARIVIVEKHGFVRQGVQDKDCCVAVCDSTRGNNKFGSEEI